MAGVGLNQPGKQTNGRGFSGSVAAKESIDRTARYVHLETVDGMSSGRSAYAENAFR